MFQSGIVDISPVAVHLPPPADSVPVCEAEGGVGVEFVSTNPVLLGRDSCIL